MLGRATHEEGGRILALVALQLDDLAQLRVVHHGAVAAKLCAKILRHGQGPAGRLDVSAQC